MWRSPSRRASQGVSSLPPSESRAAPTSHSQQRTTRGSGGSSAILLTRPADQRLARPLEPAPVDELGQRGRRRFRPSTRQASQAGEHGVGPPRTRRPGALRSSGRASEAPPAGTRGVHKLGSAPGVGVVGRAVEVGVALAAPSFGGGSWSCRSCTWLLVVCSSWWCCLRAVSARRSSRSSCCVTSCRSCADPRVSPCPCSFRRQAGLCRCTRDLRPNRLRDRQVRESGLDRTGLGLHRTAGEGHVLSIADELRLKLIEPCRAVHALSLGHREQGLMKRTGGRGERRCELQRLRNFGLSG